MKIAIDIPEEMIEAAKTDLWCGSPTVGDAIKKGTPIEVFRDRLKEVFREASETGGDLFHLSQIEWIIDGEDWL